MATASDETTPAETYLNWQRMLKGDSCRYSVEATLYTDAVVLGQTDAIGPYHFINTIAHSASTHRNDLKPATVLRTAIYLKPDQHRYPSKTDDEHYHGGDFIDELAALASFIMGVRLKAGPVNRMFEPDGDPFGEPINYSTKMAPVLIKPTNRPQVPRLLQGQNLVILDALKKLPDLNPADANTVVKVARLYQEAIWVADADPSLAWLLLVSAVETAANQCATSSRESARQRVESSIPELVPLLSKHNCTDLIEPLSELLVKFTGATRKFVDFILEFMPPAPEVRPNMFLFSFDRQNIKKAVRTVYHYRSRALHAGTAMPYPMCETPRSFGSNAAVQEIPMGLATYTMNANWTIEDTPMLLHTFEHIARQALLRWWDQLAERQD